MTPLTLSSLTAAIAAAGFAMAATNDPVPARSYAASPYEGASLTRLSQDEAATHASKVFARSDRNGDNALDADEFAALSIVTAELAQLNGFVTIEHDEGAKTIALAAAGKGALPASEHVRIDAVSRHVFYSFAGADGVLDAQDYARLQDAMFAASDLNASGDLSRRELSAYARRQAFAPTGA